MMFTRKLTVFCLMVVIFYTEVHRQRFLNEILDVGGADVLSRYVDLLEKSASR